MEFIKDKIIDLTHTLEAGMPAWEAGCGFRLSGDYKGPFLVQRVEMRAGVGTHMDAPCHCVKGGKTIEEIEVQELICPLVRIDVSDRAKEDYEISVEDVRRFEEAHGKIEVGTLVMTHTGWGRYWNDPVRYRSADEEGLMHFPGVSPEAAQELLERGIAGLAVDTLGPETGTEGRFPVHEAILGAGKYLIENVANAHLVPPIGAYGIVLPMKIEKGAEAPVRFIAII